MALDEAISSANLAYSTEGGVYDLVFGLYQEYRECPGCPWLFFDPDPNSRKNFWKNRLEFYLGIRFQGEDGAHHGWLRFSRPNTEFSTGFDLSAYDWNPLPGEPIAAGRPPVIPVHQEITPEGQLRLSWSPALATWQLEACDHLGPTVEWVPVPEAGGTEALLPLPEGQRYYRLRKP